MGTPHGGYLIDVRHAGIGVVGNVGHGKVVAQEGLDQAGDGYRQAVVPVEQMAQCLSLDAADIVTTTHTPQVASVGLPFVLVELKDRDALARARASVDALSSLSSDGITPDVHLYTRSGDEFDIRARMFAPLDGVPEDPATGSANCALAGLLAHRDRAGLES